MKNDVATALQKRADQVYTAAEAALEHTRDWQMIKKSMCSRGIEIPLTPEQVKKLERYQFIYNQLVSGKYSDADVINQLTNKRLYGLSLSQAYADMDAAKELFPSVININKRFNLHVAIEINKMRQRKCEELGDMKALAQFEKNGIALQKEIPDQDENPADMFEGHQIEAMFDPRLLGAPEVNMMEVLKAINEKRDKNIKIDMFEELEFVDVKNGQDTGNVQV